MKLLAYFRALAAKFFRRSELSAELDEELRSHIEHRADDLERIGIPRAEAERRARIEFGGQEKFKEESREALGGNFIEMLIQDVRYSTRVLRKSPSFTAVAILTLAVAIGANAVVFGVLNAMILRPLNLPRENSLYLIELARDKDTHVSYPDYLDLRDRNRSFDGLAAFDLTEVGLDLGENPDHAWVNAVSGNYFDILGVQPYLGRFIHPSDELGPNSAPYIVLSYAYWHIHFHDDQGVVGRTVKLNKFPYTIVGVAGPEFHGTVVIASPDLYVPIVNEQQVYGDDHLNARGNRWVAMVVGHLKAGVTSAEAVADLNSIGSYLEKTYPNDHRKTAFILAQPGLGGDAAGPSVRAFLTGLMLLAGLILLAACANLGSLFAARAADRSREIAMRLALGASRLRVLRQLLTEAMIISIIGGAAGLWGSVMLLSAVSAWHPIPRYPIHMSVNPDAKVYGVALLLSLASGLMFGVAPIKQIFQANPYQIIKSGSVAPAGRRISARELMIGAQIAICAVLVTSSIVAVRGMARSLHSNFGFESRNAMLVDADLNTGGYARDAVPAMQKRMIDAMRSIPGVESVGVVDYVPLSFSSNDLNIFNDTESDLSPSNAVASATTFKISPEYFQAAGTVLLSGRTFTWHDDKNTPRVAIVNRVFASKLFGSPESAIGKYFKGEDGKRTQVVGVAEDGKYFNLTEGPAAAMFLPILQSPSSETVLVIRSGVDPQQLTPAIRTAMRNMDAGLPFFMQTWDKWLAGALFPARAATESLGVLGVMGAMLSVTGIFGMAAYSVSKRKRELGIRIALGAQRKEVLQAALGRAVKLLAFGSAIGLLLGILASKLLAVIVYQATPRDPLVLAGVVLAMMLLGLLATWVPAQRALSIDPMILMREE
jgi:predicted permease